MRDGSKAAVAARKALKRPPGRPLQLTATIKPLEPSDDSTEATKKPKKRSLKHIKSRRKMSLLEKLPTELIVEIFLYSMNLDLPRSSPVIAGKLTNELVYTRTIIEAFGPTWEKDYGNYVLGIGSICQPGATDDDYLRDFPEPRPQKYGGDGDGKLQSAILRCRWASLSVLQKSQETWISQYCKDRTFTPLLFLVNTDIGAERITQKDRRDRKLTPAKFFEEDFVAFSSFFMAQTRTQVKIRHSTIVDGMVKDWSSYVDVAGDFEIPQRLLLGPWTEEMTRFLYWLVKGGARLDWLNSTSGESAMLGLKRAVVDGDLRVIHLLFWAGLWEHVGAEEMLWVIQVAGRDRLNVVTEVISMWEDVVEGVLAERGDILELDEERAFIGFVLKELHER